MYAPFGPPTVNAPKTEPRAPRLLDRVRQACAKRAGVVRHVTPHVFRHAFARHLLEDGYDIRTVQELLGHASVETTMIDTHVLNRGGRGVRSPLDGLG